MGSEDHEMTFEENVLTSWRGIGLAENLATDTDIARFLVSLYGRLGGKDQEDANLKCCQCCSPLTLLCTSCDLPHLPFLSMDHDQPRLVAVPVVDQVQTSPGGLSLEDVPLAPQGIFFQQQAVILPEPLLLQEDLSVGPRQAMFVPDLSPDESELILGGDPHLRAQPLQLVPGGQVLQPAPLVHHALPLAVTLQPVAPQQEAPCAQPAGSLTGDVSAQVSVNQKLPAPQENVAEFEAKDSAELGSGGKEAEEGHDVFDLLNSPSENEAPEFDIAASHPIPHPCDEAENNFGEGNNSSPGCSTEVRRSRFGRVLVPKNDPIYVDGTKRSCTITDSRGKPSPTNQVSRPVARPSSVDKHCVEKGEDVKSVTTLLCQYQIKKDLKVSIERCDKVSENPYRNVQEEKAAIWNNQGEHQEHTHGERKGLKTTNAREVAVENRGTHPISEAMDSTSTSGATTEDHTDLDADGPTGPRSLSTSGQPAGTVSEEKAEAPKTSDTRTPGNSMFQCSHCQQVFQHRTFLFRHILSHFQTKNEKQCQPESEDPGEADEADSTKPFICKQCGRSYKMKSSLLLHLRKHTKPGDYLECSLCGQSFALERNLVRHKKKVHPTDGRLQCRQCSFDCTEMRELKKHMKKIHWKRTTQQCEFCGLHMSPQRLQAHILFHKGEKPFSCDICGRRFRTRSQLNAHCRAHHGEIEQPFRCDQCGRGFVKAQSLRYHMFGHTGEKPYKCSRCPSVFVRKDYLDKHMRTHTGVRPYQCDICKQKFAFVSSLNSHKKKLHGVIKQNTQGSDHVYSSNAQTFEIPVQSLELLKTAYLLPVYPETADDIVYSSTLDL